MYWYCVKTANCRRQIQTETGQETGLLFNLPVTDSKPINHKSMQVVIEFTPTKRKTKLNELKVTSPETEKGKLNWEKNVLRNRIIGF